MAKKRVFVSFDFDNDKTLKDFIVGQAKLPDSPFEIIDTSLQEAAPLATWEKRAKASIARSDLVLVMVGAKTHRAPGVIKEVAMARAAKIRAPQPAQTSYGEAVFRAYITENLAAFDESFEAYLYELTGYERAAAAK